MPAHTHTLQANLNPNPATQANPSPNLLGQLTIPIYGGATNLQTAAPASIANTGGLQPHTNLQPYLVLNFCIALQGIFPSRN
jgi:microcystin-dependent protein